jgi:competence protein ComEA
MEKNKKIAVAIIVTIAIVIIVIATFIINKKEETEITYEDFFDVKNVISNVVSDSQENTEESEEEKIKVYVTGEVNNPGVIELKVGARIEDAIKLAGGLTENANLEEVNLAYCLEDGQKLYIPNVNEKEVEYLSTENGEKVLETTEKSNSSKININTGGVEELKGLPGVGESLAQRIITYREENGKFKSVDELKNVSGIGDKKFEALKDYVIIK